MHTIWSKEYSTLYLYSPLICAFVHTKKERGGMEIMRAFLLVGIIASLISAASAIGGTATFYSKYVRKCLYNVEWLFELFFFFEYLKPFEHLSINIYIYHKIGHDGKETCRIYIYIGQNHILLFFHNKCINLFWI